MRLTSTECVKCLLISRYIWAGQEPVSLTSLSVRGSSNPQPSILSLSSFSLISSSSPSPHLSPCLFLSQYGGTVLLHNFLSVLASLIQICIHFLLSPINMFRFFSKVFLLLSIVERNHSIRGWLWVSFKLKKQKTNFKYFFLLQLSDQQ